MPFILRFIFLAFVFELGVYNAIQAGENIPLIQVEKSFESFRYLTPILKSNDLHNNFSIFEILENTEVNETNEEENEEFINFGSFYYRGISQFVHKKSKTTLKYYHFSFSNHSIPFFIIFHSWKFHL